MNYFIYFMLSEINNLFILIYLFFYLTSNEDFKQEYTDSSTRDPYKSIMGLYLKLFKTFKLRIQNILVQNANQESYID